MSQNYGIPVPPPHEHTDVRDAVRYVVLIESGGHVIARLFLADRTQVAEFDGGAEEVAMMTHELLSSEGASGSEWDHALGGHSAEERAQASVFTLET